MSRRLAVLLAASLACAPAHAATRLDTRLDTRPDANTPAGARPELNDAYRSPAKLRKWRRSFEREGREVRDRKPAILADLPLKPGMAVADVGSGTGLYTLDLARAVGPDGPVYAVDIIPHFLRHVGKQAARAGLANVTLVQAGADALNLAPGSVDLVFLCDVYHHLERPAEVLAAIRRVLRPGGALVVLDLDRVSGVSPKWIFRHVRAGKTEVLAELGAAGFTLTADRSAALGLRDNYFLHLRPDEAPRP